MLLSTILSPERTLCGALASSKKRVLENAASFIAESLPGVKSDELFANLVNRERLGSTGLGEGIAIPHCRLKSIQQVVGSLITLAEPIDFEAIDDRPVDILFVLVVPEDATDEHLKTLAGLAELFSQPAFVDQLRQATDSDALYRAAVSYPT
ncbi:MAG TPA: PTS IIA-like nitrogen regulatory protein PtsN [Spongiibacteraceae bacterium]|jgi:PTS system nitrogen regulatory IIA component|nr:PTS IIA-like nitrogen regulatory protein PtsN [Spongiibacteraceae bacterium]HUH36861.1 PTS IIA-like nitrogen regulatory protein PtsN [Spongiibacteraceae bacterium]